MKSSTFLFIFAWTLTHVVKADECLPCSDGLEPFLIDKLCENAVELMKTLTSGKIVLRGMDTTDILFFGGKIKKAYTHKDHLPS